MAIKELPLRIRIRLWLKSLTVKISAIVSTLLVTLSHVRNDITEVLLEMGVPAVYADNGLSIGIAILGIIGVGGVIHGRERAETKPSLYEREFNEGSLNEHHY